MSTQEFVPHRDNLCSIHLRICTQKTIRLQINDIDLLSEGITTIVWPRRIPGFNACLTRTIPARHYRQNFPSRSRTSPSLDFRFPKRNLSLLPDFSVPRRCQLYRPEFNPIKEHKAPAGVPGLGQQRPRCHRHRRWRRLLGHGVLRALARWWRRLGRWRCWGTTSSLWARCQEPRTAGAAPPPFGLSQAAAAPDAYAGGGEPTRDGGAGGGTGGAEGIPGLQHLCGRHGVLLTPTRAAWSRTTVMQATSSKAPRPLASSQAAALANAKPRHLDHATEGKR